MKYGIFSLLSSIAIIASNLAFATDQKTDFETRAAGRGAFSVLNDDCVVEIIGYLPPRDMVSISRTSKEMLQLSNNTCIWENIARRESIELDPLSGLCIKDQVKNGFLPFLNPNQKYTVTIARLLSFKKNPIQDPKYPATYEFSLGKHNFILRNAQTGPDRLELLEPDDSVTFCSLGMAETSNNCPPNFCAIVNICTNPESTRGLRFNSPEYAKIAYDAVMSGESVSNSFHVLPKAISDEGSKK